VNEAAAPGYISFPLQPEQEAIQNWGEHIESHISPVLANVSFRLYLSYQLSSEEDSLRTEVEAAIWAWENFGGVGGRTRRGFGALQLKCINEKVISPPAHTKVHNELQERYSKYIGQQTTWPAGVPHINKFFVAAKEVKTEQEQERKMPFFDDDDKTAAHIAWEHLINHFRDFRQSRPGLGSRHPGRSHWPEPDAIRRLTHQNLPAHEPQHESGNVFPRLAFGAPIIVKFKDNKYNTPDQHLDPQQSTLKLRGYERFASPLCLRPYQAAKKRAVGLIVELTTTFPTNDVNTRGENNLEYVLVESDGTMQLAPIGLDEIEASKIKPLISHPPEGHDAHTNVFEGFRSTLILY
jgi:CRISPR-associated protein Cmr1